MSKIWSKLEISVFPDLGGGELGPVGLAKLLADELRVLREVGRGQSFLGGGPTGGGVGFEGRRADRDDLDGIVRLEREDGIAGVDGPENIIGYNFDLLYLLFCWH